MEAALQTAPPLDLQPEPQPAPRPLPVPPPPPPPPRRPGTPPAPAPPDDGGDEGRDDDEGPEGGDGGRSALVRETVHLATATRAARELTLAALRLTNGRGAAPRVAAELRRHTAATALALEKGTPRALLHALRSVWRVADLADRAERENLLTMDESVELLTLGSRAEVPLVALLSPCGRSLASG